MEKNRKISPEVLKNNKIKNRQTDERIKYTQVLGRHVRSN